MAISNSTVARFGYIGAAIVLAGIGGWIANIVKMFYAMNDPVTVMIIARAAGIVFAPLGAILGYM